MYLFLVFLNFAVWSTSFPFGKIALQVSSPLFITGSRMIIASIIILGYLIVKRRNIKIQKKTNTIIIITFNLCHLLNKCIRVLGTSISHRSKSLLYI